MSNNGKSHTDDDSPGGLAGTSLFSEKQQLAGGVKHLRSDARMAARIMSCGVVEPEQMKDLMSGMFFMAVQEMSKAEPSVRNITALLKVFEAAAKLEQDERKIQMAVDANNNVNVNLDVGIGHLPVIEVVVNDRDEVQQFTEMRDKLAMTLKERRNGHDSN